MPLVDGFGRLGGAVNGPLATAVPSQRRLAESFVGPGKDTNHKHTFRFSRVRTQGPLTIPQACARCHKTMDVEQTLSEWKHGD